MQYLRRRKCPGGAKFNCTDSLRSPNKGWKFSCKAGTGSLPKKKNKTKPHLSEGGVRERTKNNTQGELGGLKVSGSVLGILSLLTVSVTSPCSVTALALWVCVSPTKGQHISCREAFWDMKIKRKQKWQYWLFPHRRQTGNSLLAGLNYL